MRHVLPAWAFGAVRPVGAIPPTATAANYDVPRQTGLHLRDKSPRNCGVVLRHLDQSHLIFDPLDNRNLALRINYQKVGLLKESQEVVSKWGLGRSI